ncbi:MAG TPA: 16S rRNA (cytosine(1402)-N(4))-methyltransferase RsmH [Rhizobiales bacterium]|nr:16S rRNA (cytosine(1402)-N(4))-methyltransferase RsmH [Hyphomicrobiales bacterium]
MIHAADIPDYARHRPVLLASVLEALAPRDGGIYVDGTFGAGGYSRAILEKADCKVYAIDRDPDAIAAGAEMVEACGGRLVLIEGRFSELDRLIDFQVDGAVLDIGVSSMQLDEAERGFSFTRDGPLDMRMSREGLSAADVVNNFNENQLKRIIGVYGEERRAHAIAAAIGRARREKPFTRTGELARLVEKVLGQPGPRGKHKTKTIHPATRTFQALRIFVNGELDELVHGLAAAERRLKPGGRLCVVTFHSLEDRIVKRFFKRRTGAMPNPSRHLPQQATLEAPSFENLLGGGVVAGDDETAINPRARSARLRAAVRTGAPAIGLDEAETMQGYIEGVG